MQEQLSRRRDKLFSLGLHMQPLVVLVGKLERPEAVYVVVDRCTWKISTALKAVDICFKAFHVFHASYPAETSAWLLLQKLVYEISTKWDSKSSAVMSLLSDFNK